MTIPFVSCEERKIMKKMPMNRGSHENRTRLSWWFPKLPDCIPTPETVIILYTGEDLINMLDGDILPNFSTLSLAIQIAGDELGWPLFLRTDYLSGKHSWKKTCHVPDPKFIKKRVLSLVEESAIADIMGFPTDYWIARKFIPTTPAFHAFYGEMPIVKERRYFVQDDKVVCHHPYWPMEAFTSRDLAFRVPNWEVLLADMNVEGVDEVNLLSELSSKVGGVLGGAWSIDWLWSEEEGIWYLIDMAAADQSYHWTGCPIKEGKL